MSDLKSHDDPEKLTKNDESTKAYVGNIRERHLLRRIALLTLGIGLFVLVGLLAYCNVGSDAAYRRGQLGVGDKVAMRLPGGTSILQKQYDDVVASLTTAGDTNKADATAKTAKVKASELFALRAFLIESAKQSKTVVSAELLQKCYVKAAHTTLSADEYKEKLKRSGGSGEYLQLISEIDAYQQVLGPKLIKQKSVTIVEAPWRVLEGVPLDKLAAVQSELASDFDQNYRKLLVNNKSYEEIQSAIAGKNLKSISANLAKQSSVSVTKSSPYPAGRPDPMAATSTSGLLKDTLVVTNEADKSIKLPEMEAPFVDVLTVGQVTPVIKSNSGKLVAIRLDTLSAGQPYDSWQALTTQALTKAKTYSN